MGDGILIGKLRKGAPHVAVIMAGGSGTRFWPVSRQVLPKQFLQLSLSGRTLIQATVDRLHGFVDDDCIAVVTTQNQAALVNEQLPDVAVIVEPEARNTAACLGLAAIRVLHDVGDVPMVCLPSDHLISGDSGLRKLYEIAASVAMAHDVIVTIGIPPTGPDTAYGYIEEGEKWENARRVKRFVEKPDLTTAQGYLSQGGFLWNSGMFIWRPSVLLAAIDRFVPEMGAVLRSIGECFGHPNESEKVAPLYHSLKSLSIDIGVLEKAENVVVFPGDGFSWSDIGSWDAWLEQIQQAEGSIADGNYIKGDAHLVGCRNVAVINSGISMLGKQSGKYIAGIGLEDLFIVETEDAFLVCRRDKAQDVKRIVDELKAKGREQLF